MSGSWTKLHSFAGSTTASPVDMAAGGSIFDPMSPHHFGKLAGVYKSQQADAAFLSQANPGRGLFEMEHMSPTIGSVIKGVDVSKPMSSELVDELRKAVLLRKVIFFEGQQMTTEEHIAFTRQFGQLEVHPFTASKPGHDEVLMVDHDGKIPGTENM